MSQRVPLSRLLDYAKSHRGQVWLATTHSILNKLFDLAPPVLIGMAVDTVVEKDASFLARMGVESIESQLIVLAVLTVLIWGAESLFEYLHQTTWRNLAQTLQHELRLDATKHVQQLEVGWFQKHSTGRLMAVLNDDINQLERFLDGGANDVLQVTTTVIAISAVYFWMSPGVAGLAMLPIPFILWGSFKFQEKIAPRYAEVREKASQVNGRLSATLSGIETVKSFVAEDHETEVIAELSQGYREANRHAIRLSSAFSPLIRMVIVVGFTATLVYGGMLTTQGVLEVGSYSVLVFLTQRLLWPLTRLGATFDLYQRAMASTQRVLDLLDTPVSIVSGDERLQLHRGGAHIRFDHITFGYPDREPILEDFSLDIPAGATVAVVGPTGAGKSTLIRLLLRFFDPQQGRVLVDGVDVRDARLDDLRQQLGLVSQGVFLFSGTVRENIRYGTFEANEDQVQAAADAAEATPFIEALPDGLDTVIGERGQTLSGGQAQRLSIARAILKDPPILLLDEATSAVDNETEAAIQRSLERVGKDRTVLVIAHRLSTIRHADRIIVMEDGRIAETGTHEQLVAADGLYSRLWKIQTGVR